MLRDLLFVENFYNNCNLEDTLIIACQHLLESTRLMFHSCFKKGLNPTNLFVIGKCYSSADFTIKNLKQDGVFVHNSSDRFNPYLSFDEQFEENVAAFFKEILPKIERREFRKIIILDDGGMLLSVAEKYLSAYLKKIAGVEQTSSGFNELKDKKLVFPIINIARSKAKLIYESPMIIQASIHAVNKILDNEKNSLGKILIVGNGAIGKNFYEALRASFQVIRFDINNLKSDLQKEDFFTRVSHFDTIIGCTGVTIFPHRYHSLFKKGTKLISASSSDREFDAVYLRRHVPSIPNSHVQIFSQGVCLFNCGFPVNFSTGDQHTSVPLQDIQFTVALLFAGICDAATEKLSNGFQPLNPIVQNGLIRHHFYR